MEIQEDILKVLQDSETTTKFSEQCKNIGQTAVAIDTSFKRVHDGFVEIIEKYGKDFPEVVDYGAQWDGFRAVSECLFFILCLTFFCRVLALGWVRGDALEVKGPCVLHRR